MTGCCASLLTSTKTCSVEKHISDSNIIGAFKDSFVDDDGDEQFVAQVSTSLFT